MKINHQVVVFDAADLTSERNFWAGVLDGTVDAEDDWHMVFVDGAPVIGVQLAPDHVPPEWPHGTPQQIHLDLWVDDVLTAHDKVMALGASGSIPPSDEMTCIGFVRRCRRVAPGGARLPRRCARPAWRRIWPSRPTPRPHGGGRGGRRSPGRMRSCFREQSSSA
jgi:hypothetical protein